MNELKTRSKKLIVLVVITSLFFSLSLSSAAAAPITIRSVTFWEKGIGTDFTGSVASIGGAERTVTDLVTCFPITSISDITFSFHSPLVVNSGKQYVWDLTTSNLVPPVTGQSGTLPADTDGVVTAWYVTQYMVAFSSTSGGSVNPSGNNWVNEGTVPIVAIPNSGYSFHSWTSTGLITISNPQSSTASATVSGPGSITANFVESGVTQYVINPNVVGHGSISPSQPVLINAGNDVTFTFVPESQFAVASIKIDGQYVPMSNTYTFTNVQSDHSILVTFESSATPINHVPVTFTSNAGPGKFIKIDGANVLTPSTYYWEEGSVHTVEALPMVNMTAGTRYQFMGWSDGQAQKHNITASFQQNSVTAEYKTQYQLTVRVNFGTTDPQSGTWFDSGSDVRLTAQSPDKRDGEEYIFGGWKSTSGGYSGGSNPSDSFKMNGPTSMTTEWQHIYRLTIATERGEVVGEGWYEVGESEYVYMRNATVPVDDVTRYQFSGWEGDYNTPSLGVLVTLDGPKSMTAKWTTQHRLVFDQEGLDQGATGSVLTLNGTSVYFYSFPYISSWLDEGSSVPYTFATNIDTSRLGYQIALEKVDGPASPLVVAGSVGTITATYLTQNVALQWLNYGLVILLALGLLFVYLRRRKK